MSAPIAVRFASLAFVAACAAPAAAQVAPAAPPAPPPASTGGVERARQGGVDARYKVRVMEGVLEKSVQQAALRLNEQLQRVSPDLIQLTGAAHARGYRLEGYGLFFDVEVPAAMRQTMGWTARVMRQQQQGVAEALGSLKRLAGDLDPKQRAEAERAVQQLEIVVRPVPTIRGQKGRGPQGAVAVASGADASTPGQAGLPGEVGSPGQAGSSGQAASAGQGASPDQAAAPSAEASPTAEPTLDATMWRNPDLAYEEHVREALIGAMLEWGALLPLGPDEWLTVAARDNQDVIMPGASPDVVTIILRVKGSDLADRLAGRVPLEELRRRVEVTEF